MLEVPTIIGLGLGFDGSANWVNKFIVDPYLLGIKSEDSNPETHSLLREVSRHLGVSFGDDVRVLFHVLPLDVLFPVQTER